MRYIGSKTKLLPFIDEVVTELKKEYKIKSIGDLFTGNGSVAKYYKEKGYEITTNDLQYYSYVISKFYIENNEEFDDVDEYIEKLNNLEGVEGFIYNNYALGSGSGRMYYTDNNAKKIDVIRQTIEKDYVDNKLSEGEYYMYLTFLLEASDKVANVTGIYGAFLKQFKKSSEQDIIIKKLPGITSSNKHKVLIGDSNKVVKDINVDLLYLDPPYNSRQYSDNYHLLETIAKYDAPIIKGKTGQRTDNNKSSYSKRKEVETVLEDLVKNSNSRLILMSYNDEGLLTMEQIKDMFSKYGNYKLFTKEYKRYKSNNLTDKNTVNECLHLLIKQ